MGLALNGTFYGTHWDLAISCGKHLRILCRDEDTETRGGEGALPAVHSKKAVESVCSFTTVSTSCTFVNESARMCVVVCAASTSMHTSYKFHEHSWQRGEDRHFYPYEGMMFWGVNLAFKVALEDTCMLLAWGCHRQHLFCTAGNAPSKALLCTLLDFHAETLPTAGIRRSEVLDTWSTKWNRCASWCVHRCVHENQTTVILRIKHNLGLRVYNPFPECWMQIVYVGKVFQKLWRTLQRRGWRMRDLISLRVYMLSLELLVVWMLPL